MSPPSTRAPMAWIIGAHTIGALTLGVLEAVRLGRGSLAMAVLPLFAATGLVAGVLIATVERVAGHRAWWQAALALAAPSLLVLVPVSSTLFEGAFAQTLPLAGVLRYLLPVVAWLVIALVIATGRRLLRATDLTTRAIAILGCAGAIGAIVWAERNVLRSGYPDAHVGATLALIVIAGTGVRVARRANISIYLAAVIAGLSLGTATATMLDGLRSTVDRRVLAVRGDQARDLVRLWRQFVDRDGDGSSPVLGGGDCSDRDAGIHPGAADIPGDDIDQDCDGADAEPAPPAIALPKPTDVASWRDGEAVKAFLAHTQDMHVLLVTVDALRFDILAPEAPDRGEFPNLVALLDKSVWFTRAVAPASGTDVSIGTLLTGRADPFQSIATTLPEAMRTSGRYTANALPGEVTRYVGETLLARGFDRTRTVHTDWGDADIGDHVSAPATTLEGLRAWDNAAGAPSFVWLHYFDVHEHHQIDVPASLMKAVSANGSRKRRVYRALLLAIDKEIGRLHAELAQRGMADQTIIVFASDHGESLGEDPRLGETHGKVAYAPLVRIPIAVHVPGMPGGLRTDPVSLVDLAPTLLALVGAPTAMAPLDGIDLVPALLDAPDSLRHVSRALAIHEELQWSVVDWPYQLLVRPADDVVELYDIAADPSQQQDLSAKEPAVVTRLRARYAEGPQVRVDRTIDGRRWREQQAQPPQPRAPR